MKTRCRNCRRQFDAPVNTKHEDKLCWRCRTPEQQAVREQSSSDPLPSTDIVREFLSPLIDSAGTNIPFTPDPPSTDSSFGDGGGFSGGGSSDTI
jgi:hypothetical protein